LLKYPLRIFPSNTYHYLVFLKTKISKILENDGNMLDASKIDQSKFHYLKNYESIAGKNAQWELAIFSNTFIQL
jgi:hypothetical protein